MSKDLTVEGLVQKPKEIYTCPNCERCEVTLVCDFCGQHMEEQRPTVDRAFVEKWGDTVVYEQTPEEGPNIVIGRGSVIEMLKEAGVGVDI